MSKGLATHEHILTEASALASSVGLEGLSIGALAEALDMSKSGLFAHFRSKEALQIQVLDHTARQFVETVVRPAFQHPRGEPRLRALFEGWLEWGTRGLPGGCLFVAASVELDDQPGPVRDRLAHIQQEWFQAIAKSYALGVDAGSFRPDWEPEQFAQELAGILLAFHHRSRLIHDPRAGERARRAFDRLLDSARRQNEERS